MSQIKYHEEPGPEGQHGYVLDEDFVYYSKRYNRTKTCYKGMWSDGATMFVDLGSDHIISRFFAWVRNRVHHMQGNQQSGWFWTHDAFCNDGCWDCGTLICNWEASTVAADLLWDSGYRLWSVPIWHATFLFGGGEARKNGLRRVKLDKGEGHKK